MNRAEIAARLLEKMVVVIMTDGASKLTPKEMYEYDIKHLPKIAVDLVNTLSDELCKEENE